MLSKDQEMVIATRVVQDQQRLKQEKTAEMDERLYIMIVKAIVVEVPIIATRENILSAMGSQRRNHILMKAMIIINLSKIIRSIRCIIKSITMVTSIRITIKNIIILHHGHTIIIRQYFITMILVNSFIIVEDFTGIIGNMDIM
jgi:hypothetical protein